MSSLPFSPQRQGEEGLSLSDEVILTSLALEGGIAWSLCHSKTSGETFIIARAASDEAAFQVTQLLKNEFALRHQLADSWAIIPTGHTFYHGRYALIYPPFSFKTLTSLMRSPLPAITEFLSNAIKLCAPLSEMHLQGLIHGNIKPSNYFYDHDGAFRLSGFGLSSASAEALLHSRLPVSGGTLAYMSPEHTTRTPYRVNSLSDLYSLGIVLYELLTGKLPFMPAEGDIQNGCIFISPLILALHISSGPMFPPCCLQSLCVYWQSCLKIAIRAWPDC
ncbi:protein kinase [Pantoea sp. LMR881]|uniref:serine/threonine protein kinase n=1 Tax=Pantoea sp. LMR881 TaxID=3014336 RepID=UPI0022AE967B|nr:protein kinase [Pantoea sp. LMR881]MCZ4061460.1 protein kinase [Pantoea sp. LMR881]